MIFENVTECIGGTPFVRLNKIGQNYACQFVAKCEFLNPGGSGKDRIALEMVEDAEAKGLIKPGDTLIEPTSGNTGIGLAMVGAAKGYQVIITMPEKCSYEKQVVIEALGAKIYRTPCVEWDDPNSHIMMAKHLQQQTPNSHILDQYSNPANAQAHYEQTGREIYEALGDDLAMVVMGVGTGGTITGVARYLKEKNPDIKIIGADPDGSILSGGDPKPYLLEGIGYDFYPEVLDTSVIDGLIKVFDKESFLMARRLIRDEGLLVGGSSGSAVCAMLKAAKSLREDQTCLVILPDSIRNYLTKFADDAWMKEHDFFEETVEV